MFSKLNVVECCTRSLMFSKLVVECCTRSLMFSKLNVVECCTRSLVFSKLKEREASCLVN